MDHLAFVRTGVYRIYGERCTYVIDLNVDPPTALREGGSDFDRGPHAIDGGLGETQRITLGRSWRVSVSSSWHGGGSFWNTGCIGAIVEIE